MYFTNTIFQLEHSTRTPNKRVWRITQLAKLSFNHPSVVLTADVFQFFMETVSFNHSNGRTHSWRFSTFYKKSILGSMLFQGRRRSGVVKVSPHKNVYSCYFPRAICSCSGKRPAKHGLFLSKQIAICGYGYVSGKGCLYRHLSSPGLTPTCRHDVGRQGAPSPRLVVMPWRRERSCSRQQSQHAGRRWSMHAMHGLKN